VESPGTVAPYYEITIQPQRPYLVKGEHQYPIQPGMEVAADIISREETVLTFILRKVRLLTDL
jgi:multidrug efflux pump subunit AcrA (membrane-fusion protein)